MWTQFQSGGWGLGLKYCSAAETDVEKKFSKTDIKSKNTVFCFQMNIIICSKTKTCNKIDGSPCFVDGSWCAVAVAVDQAVRC